MSASSITPDHDDTSIFDRKDLIVAYLLGMFSAALTVALYIYYHLKNHNYDMQSAAIAWTYLPSIATSFISLTLWVVFTAFLWDYFVENFSVKKSTKVSHYFLNSFGLYLFACTIFLFVISAIQHFWYSIRVNFSICVTTLTVWSMMAQMASK